MSRVFWGFVATGLAPEIVRSQLPKEESRIGSAGRWGVPAPLCQPEHPLGCWPIRLSGRALGLPCILRRVGSCRDGGSAVHTLWDISPAPNTCPHPEELCFFSVYTVTWVTACHRSLTPPELAT